MSSESTCQTFLNSAIKSAAPAIGQAVNKLLTGALSAANIAKCLTCASKNFEDGFDKTKPNCGNDKNNSNAGSGDKKSSAPNKEEKVIKNPVKDKNPSSGTNEPEFIEYPDKFKEGVQDSGNMEKVTKFGAVANPDYDEGDVPGPIAAFV